VFSALTGDLDKDVLSRASGALLGHLGSSGNVLGVLDLAGASTGLHTLIENPSGIATAFKNFSIPSEIKLGSLNGFSDRLTGAMELYSDSWNQSSYDGMLSTSYADGYNPQVNEVFQSKLLDNTIGLDLDVPVIDDHAFMSAAYGMNNNSDLRDFI